MYRQVATDATAVWHGSNSEFKPLATLADSSGGRAQIAEDDHCLVVLLKQEDGTYAPTSWLFPEVLEVLKTLETPKPA